MEYIITPFRTFIDHLKEVNNLPQETTIHFEWSRGYSGLQSKPISWSIIKNQETAGSIDKEYIYKDIDDTGQTYIDQDWPMIKRALKTDEYRLGKPPYRVYSMHIATSLKHAPQTCKDVDHAVDFVFNYEHDDFDDDMS